MDNGPAQKKGISATIQAAGEAVGDMFSVSHLRREVSGSELPIVYSVEPCYTPEYATLEQALWCSFLPSSLGAALKQITKPR